MVRTSESTARAVVPRLITTDALTSAEPSWKAPLLAGTVTENGRMEPMQVSGNDACPEAPGCEPRMPASMTVQRSGHEARTARAIEEPSGASPAGFDWMSTI